jgi:hypothetical protein
MTISEQSSPDCDLTPLEAQLAQLRQVLIASQQEQQTAEINVRQGGARITALETLIADFNTIITRYRERFQQLKDRDDNLKEHCKKETECFEANLKKPLTDQILQEEKNIYDDLERQEKELKEKETACTATRAALADLQETLARARTALSELRELDRAIDARHQRADAQRQAVQTERDAHHYNEAYYLLKGKGKFCATVNGEPQVLTVDGLCAALKTAWDNFKKADEAYNAKDAEAQACEGAVATLRAQLEQDKAGVEARILRRIALLRSPTPSSTC